MFPSREGFLFPWHMPKIEKLFNSIYQASITDLKDSRFSHWGIKSTIYSEIQTLKKNVFFYFFFLKEYVMMLYI